MTKVLDCQNDLIFVVNTEHDVNPASICEGAVATECLFSNRKSVKRFGLNLTETDSDRETRRITDFTFKLPQFVPLKET